MSEVLFRVGVFTSFVILTLISVIQWGFRWYGLAVLLFIWAALGAWTLIRKKYEKKGYRSGRLCLRQLQRCC